MCRWKLGEVKAVRTGSGLFGFFPVQFFETFIRSRGPVLGFTAEVSRFVTVLSELQIAVLIEDLDVLRFQCAQMQAFCGCEVVFAARDSPRLSPSGSGFRASGSRPGFWASARSLSRLPNQQQPSQRSRKRPRPPPPPPPPLRLLVLQQPRRPQRPRPRNTRQPRPLQPLRRRSLRSLRLRHLRNPSHPLLLQILCPSRHPNPAKQKTKSINRRKRSKHRLLHLTLSHQPLQHPQYPQHPQQLQNPQHHQHHQRHRRHQHHQHRRRRRRQGVGCRHRELQDVYSRRLGLSLGLSKRRYFLELKADKTPTDNRPVVYHTPEPETPNPQP